MISEGKRKRRKKQKRGGGGGGGGEQWKGGGKTLMCAAVKRCFNMHHIETIFGYSMCTNYMQHLDPP